MEAMRTLLRIAITATWAGWIGRYRQRADGHRLRIEQQEPGIQRLAIAREDLDGLGRLDAADDTDEWREHAFAGATLAFLSDRKSVV